MLARAVMHALVGVLVGAVGCARPQATAPGEAPPVFVAPESASRLTDVRDLLILRHRAAMGEVAAVREQISPRLAMAAAEGSDAGRDALRRLAIELAIVQGDVKAAARELSRLDADVRRLGPAATAEERAVVALLEGELYFQGGRYLDARRHDLRALALLEPEGSPLVGNALRGLARDSLALGQPSEALEQVMRAIEQHRRSGEAEARELVEDFLLAVEILVALRLGDEALIAAGDAYDAAIERFGSGSLPHAEALLAVAAASLARGEGGAAGSLVSDAAEIHAELQAAQLDPSRPVSQRLDVRLRQLQALVPAAAGP